MTGWSVVPVPTAINFDFVDKARSCAVTGSTPALETPSVKTTIPESVLPLACLINSSRVSPRRDSSPRGRRTSSQSRDSSGDDLPPVSSVPTFTASAARENTRCGPDRTESNVKRLTSCCCRRVSINFVFASRFLMTSLRVGPVESVDGSRPEGFPAGCLIDNDVSTSKATLDGRYDCF